MLCVLEPSLSVDLTICYLKAIKHINQGGFGFKDRIWSRGYSKRTNCKQALIAQDAAELTHRIEDLGIMLIVTGRFSELSKL